METSYQSIIQILTALKELNTSCFLFAELIATQLLDLIHVLIEGPGDQTETELSEKKFSDYFAEFLFEKDVDNCRHLLDHIHPEIK